MDELGRELVEDTGEAMSGTGIASAMAELRKRRSTRIVQAVPLTVAGVDALGRPFTERTSTLIINCHGCRYQSKHYVLKNMWVTLEVPHPETGQPPRTVRGRVAWIQRPRTVRQLFQVALELELPGNAWGIAFPPEDWFAFPEAGHPITADAPGSAHSLEHSQPSAEADEQVQESHSHPPAGADFNLPLSGADAVLENHSERLRAFPARASTTDASMQLARQLTRLLADARQQIHAAAREAAAQAVSAERRITADEWQQKIAADREMLSRELAAALENVRQESASVNRIAQSAAAEALQRDLPQRLAPQLEELTRNLTAQLSQEALAQRNASTEQAGAAVQTLRSACIQAEQLLERLREQVASAETRIASSAESSARAAEEAARQRESSATALADSLHAKAKEIQEHASAFLSTAQQNWQNYLAGELEAAQGRVQIGVDNAIVEAQVQAAESVNEHASAVLRQFQQEAERVQAGFREAAALAASESDLRLGTLKDVTQAHAERIESTLARAGEALAKLEHFPERIEAAQRHALAGFQSQLDDVLSLHRNELHRRSESLFEEISARIHATFEESSRQAAAQFGQQVESLVQPHLQLVEEGIHRMAGGRSMLDAATSLQQERIRVTADEAFAEALASFRGNLGGVEQLLRESADAVTARSLADLEGKAESTKHQVVDDLLKSAEWYEKKAQTQIQHFAERAAEQAEARLRERAGEISAMFASELDNASRNFVGHTHNQMEEVVRDAFERARALFSEAAETTSAAFIDEIQRQARQELGGFEAEAQKYVRESKAHLEAARADLSQQVTAEQESFLRRFQTAMSGAVEAGVTEANQKVQAGFGPLLDAWKSMTESQQAELRGLYARVGEQAAESFRGRLENVSNQWMLATVASLDHQSREVVSGIAATAEEKLRDTCTRVFADIGESLRERLTQIASKLSVPPPIPH
jgi:phage gp36-like protein